MPTNQNMLWPVEVNWKDPFFVGYEYKTDIFTSRYGNEDRRSERKLPRVKYQYTGLAHGDDLRRVRAIIDLYGAEPYVLCDPIYKAVISFPMLANTTAIQFTSIPAWVVVDGYVVIAAPSGKHLAKVTAVNLNTVTLDTPIPFAVDAGTPVHLGVTVMMKRETTISSVTDEVGTIKCELDARVGESWLPDEGVALATYRSRELFTKAPNWATRVDRQFIAAFESLDYDSGRVHYETKRDYNTHITKAEYVSLSKGEAQDLLAFFMRQRGRRGDFFTPTHTSDFRVITSSGNTLTVAGDEAALYDADPLNKNLYITKPDGEIIYRRIAAASVAGGNTAFTLNSAPGTVTTGAKCGWLHLSRFAVDELEFEWLTDEVAQFATSIQTLIDES